MNTLAHRLIVDEFRQYGGTLTGPQIADVVGFGWRRDIHEMRKAGYLIVEDGAGWFHLDLEALPDVGRAGDEPPHADAAPPSADACPVGPANVASSPDAGHETPALPLEVERPRPASPYDPSVEAA